MAITYEEIGGIETNLRVEGEGSPILILHGWGASIVSWKKIQENLARENFKIYCPDLPGFGKSQKFNQAWNLDDYCDWVINFCDYFNLDNLSIIGHSFGGRLAIKLNQKEEFKQRINKNILVSPAGAKLNLNKKQKILLTFSKLGDFIFSLPFLNLLKKKVKKIYYSFLPKTDYTKASPIMQETMKKVIEEDLTPLLSNMGKETILIWGKKDKMVPVRVSKIFEEKIENTKTFILPKIGHSPHLEVPEKLSEIIIKNL